MDHGACAGASASQGAKPASKGADQRRRAAIFKRGYYYSHGHKYVKKTVYKNGHKYYRFVRT